MNELTLSAGDRLQLVFARRGDRWEHVVRFQSAGRVIWQLNSDEGSPDGETSDMESAVERDDRWPSSPAFQNLELHTQPDGRRFALLVGMAGASHWSASVESDAAAERIMFDVACRIKMEPKWLGSSYIRSIPHRSPINSGGRAVIDAGEGSNDEPAIQHMHPIAVATTEFGFQPILETVGQRIVVRVADLSGPLPRTVRWKYTVSATMTASRGR